MLYKITNSSSHLPVFCYSGFRELLPNERHVNHQLPAHILVVVSEGILNFRENGTDIVLHKDEYYIQRAGAVIEGVIPSETPKYFYLCFTDDSLAETFQGIPLHGKCSYQQLSEKFERLHLLYLSSTQDSIEEAFLFYDIIKTLRGAHFASPKPIVEKVTSILQQEFRNDTNLLEIAQEVNYSIHYLIREFKAYHGLTPHQYVLQLRIENAKSLLTSSNASPLEIATLCGFRDVSALYRAFIKKVGQTPGQYRSKYSETVAEAGSNLYPNRRI